MLETNLSSLFSHFKQPFPSEEGIFLHRSNQVFIHSTAKQSLMQTILIDWLLRKRECNLNVDTYDYFDDYITDCLQAIQDTTLSVVHLTELPESFDIAVDQKWPPMPEVCNVEGHWLLNSIIIMHLPWFFQDGLLCVSVVLPSQNRHVRTDRPRDPNSDHHVTIGT